METCAQQDVIHHGLPTIAKFDANAIINWSDRSDGAVQRDRNIPKPTHQPTRASGPNSPASELILQRPRQHPDKVRSRQELAEAGRAYISGSIQEFLRKFAKPVMKCCRGPSLQPMNALRPSDYLHLSQGLVQKRGRFKGALSTSNHEHALSGKVCKLLMLVRVRHQASRNGLELRRATRKRSDTSCDDHPLCFKSLAITNPNPESILGALNSRDKTLIKIRDCMALVPQAILSEMLEWHRNSECFGFRSLKGLQSEVLVGRSDLCCGPVRAQKHSRRHIAVPERHRYTECTNLQSFDCAKMGCRGESIRPGADYGHITSAHKPLSSFEAQFVFCWIMFLNARLKNRHRFTFKKVAHVLPIGTGKSNASTLLARSFHSPFSVLVDEFHPAP